MASPWAGLIALLRGSGIVLKSSSSLWEVGTKRRLGCGVDGRERARSAVMGREAVELDLAWVDEGLGEADLRMLDSDLLWPKVWRPFDEGWCDQPVTATSG
jgi:hypothetical protein